MTQIGLDASYNFKKRSTIKQTNNNLLRRTYVYM